MKSILIFTLLSILAVAMATKIDKQQLCSGVCWANDIGDHDGCRDRCISGQRPTEDEAGQCQTCINDCGKYIGDLQNIALYTECWKGCYAKYFPLYVNGSGGGDKLHKQKEHIAGLPPRIRNFLGGHQYPVEKDICEISCRAQGADSITADDRTMKGCVDNCKKYPNPREQELQMSLDCYKECPTTEPSSETCLKSCIFRHAQSRAPEIDFTKATSYSPSEAAITDIDANGPARASDLRAGNLTLFSTGTGHSSLLGSPRTTKAVGLDAAETSTPSFSLGGSAESSASRQDRKKPAVSSISSATGRPYFESFLFWVHASVTIVVALVIGLQVV